MKATGILTRASYKAKAMSTVVTQSRTLKRALIMMVILLILRRARTALMPPDAQNISRLRLVGVKYFTKRRKNMVSD